MVLAPWHGRNNLLQVCQLKTKCILSQFWRAEAPSLHVGGADILRALGRTPLCFWSFLVAPAIIGLGPRSSISVVVKHGLLCVHFLSSRS